jgi:hypothetical protein
VVLLVGLAHRDGSYPSASSSARARSASFSFR